MRNLSRVFSFALLALSGAGTVSCDDFLADLFSDSCQTSSKPDYSGAWQLEGRAERTGCYDESRNGEIRVRFREPWNVRQTSSGQPESGSSAGVPDSVLEMETGSTATVVSNTRTNGLCVQWTTQEVYQLEDGTEVSATLRWSGETSTFGRSIEGDFTGTSSDGCVYDGTFQVEID